MIMRTSESGQEAGLPAHPEARVGTRALHDAPGPLICLDPIIILSRLQSLTYGGLVNFLRVVLDPLSRA